MAREARAERAFRDPRSGFGPRTSKCRTNMGLSLAGRRAGMALRIAPRERQFALVKRRRGRFRETVMPDRTLISIVDDDQLFRE